MSCNPYIYNKEILLEEELKHAPIDSWYVVTLSHSLFNPSYLYSLIPLFEEIEFVDSVYIASNGLVRLNLKGRPSTVFEDIAIHPGNENIKLIRDHRKEYNNLEDEVIELIQKYTKNIISKIESWDY